MKATVQRENGKRTIEVKVTSLPTPQGTKAMPEDMSDLARMSANSDLMRGFMRRQRTVADDYSELLRKRGRV